MEKLSVFLENCYGIKLMDYVFDFTANPRGRISKAYAIYAPNGIMKTSFSKTFDCISKGEIPREERYQRPSVSQIEVDNLPLTKNMIYVLKSEIDISADSPAITNILVNPENKARYDTLIDVLEKTKSKLVRALQKKSKVKATEIEGRILEDFDAISFPQCVYDILGSEHEKDTDYLLFEYSSIFDPKVVDVIKSQEFINKAKEFNDRYQELFSQSGTIYKRGVFNPARAETSFSTLDKQGFFAGGHRVHLNGDSSSVDKEELNEKIKKIHSSIDADETLKKIRLSLAKNIQTQALNELIETLSSSQVELLLEKLKESNRGKFRQDLWRCYIHSCPEAVQYANSYVENFQEITAIETAAAQAAPRWCNAVRLFNDRFLDMPFTLSIANQAQVTLGKEPAKLIFIFRDGDDIVEWSRHEVRTLSQGEKRAMYLLNFIFEIEERKDNLHDTVFIIDDVADSFDYKNKHAIVQYLQDISEIDSFYQIILTHNFDFFRTLANSFVNRSRCIMVNKKAASIELVKADGINNYFTNVMKRKIDHDDTVLCATVPFCRNIIEYTKGADDVDYIALTNILHWKESSMAISTSDYINIYNKTFNVSHIETRNEPIIELIFVMADHICNKEFHAGLNLEDKVLLSIAIRLRAEIFLTNKLRLLKEDPDYWCQSQNQFGALLKEFSRFNASAPEIRILEKISITVSSNIHLNSFMYEPILDLTIEHLIHLYLEVFSLES